MGSLSMRPVTRTDTVQRAETLLHVFDTLRRVRAFEKRNLPFLEALTDFDLLTEIGYHQARGEPLTLKALLLQGVGSIATVQRRLHRLRKHGAIAQRRCAHDARSVELTLQPKVLRICEQYAEHLAPR
jgi:DNA-binding MarR family transcriptional regulator